MSTIQLSPHSVKTNAEEMLLNRILAHEMKNNLDLIQMGIHELQNGKVKDPHQTLKILQSASNSLTGLFEAFKSGFSHPEFQLSNLNDVILEQLTMLESTAQEKGIKLDFKNYDEDIAILSDANALGRSFFNLIKNSVEACEMGDSITIEAYSVSHSAHVKISDTGRGMDSQTLHSLWKPFFTTKMNDDECHGLGACIARTTILNHNGSIFAESHLNSGTTIHISLPLYRSSFAA